MSAIENMKNYEELAQQGTNGDTELRVIEGKGVSHVNVYEAWLADNYGIEGQKLVKELGSGTINENTGLYEFGWWDDTFGKDGLGGSLGDAWDHTLGKDGLFGSIGDAIFGNNDDLVKQSKNIMQRGSEGVTIAANQAFKPGGTFDIRKDIETDAAVTANYGVNMAIDKGESTSNMAMSGNVFNNTFAKTNNINNQTTVQNKFNQDKQNMALEFRDKVNNLLMGYAQATGEAYSGANNMYDELDNIIDGSV